MSNNPRDNKNITVSSHLDLVVPNVKEKVEQTKVYYHDSHEDKNSYLYNDLSYCSDYKSLSNSNSSNKQDNKFSENKLTYDDKVIQKIIKLLLKNVDGLLTVDSCFFSNISEKLVNTDNKIARIETEFGTKQVAVDMSVVVEYGKDINSIFKQVKEIINKEAETMTHLDVIEVNVNVVDIRSKE